ncbi:MAG: RNA-binding transcriptional accessory protein [Bacteroidetes bacterium]|nr:RNA-binding transcriptional accessory protein [Bacteroidota bacterium]
MHEIAIYASLISKELNLDYQNVRNTLSLLAEGATIPFIARYRKEKTGSMDEEVIAALQKRLQQLQALDKRKETVLVSIAEQDKLTPELKKLIEDAATMQELEDIYLPFKPKRRTRATIAREKGLEPLALFLLEQQFKAVEPEARRFVNAEKGVNDISEALAGARDIVAEMVAENRLIRERIRQLFHRTSTISSAVVEGKEDEGKTFRLYFEWNETLAKAPSHRILALFRGENEGFLKVKLSVENEKALPIIERVYIKEGSLSASHLKLAVADSWKRLLEPSIENDVRALYKEKADAVAIKVFAENLRQLLLAPPLGPKRVLAIDPGFRTGCKIVVLNENGQLLHNDTIYPHPPNHEVKQAIQKLKNLVNSYKIDVIAVGNGTAGRETEDLIRGIRFDTEVMALMVNESGASVYSASKVARDEFPDYDITVRGGVSIGRRLMDPLAELVKIDPKSIGVGQYQHDVDQKALHESLVLTVESCVNAVGVELNTASEQLLSYVSGVGPQLAANIIRYRNEAGGFKSRKELLKVSRLGEKAYEQCAGFLRIREGINPLDASAVHPESYPVVEKIASQIGMPLTDLIGKKDLRNAININDFINSDVGKETLNDILNELEKPGRDPRQKFEMFEFSKNIRSVSDLQPGMELNGIVTNITAFGAFVDVGVHQDGLVHLSQLAERFIRDPNEVVKINQKVRVKVLEVDLDRKRINLTMKL